MRIKPFFPILGAIVATIPVFSCPSLAATPATTSATSSPAPSLAPVATISTSANLDDLNEDSLPLPKATIAEINDLIKQVPFRCAVAVGLVKDGKYTKCLLGDGGVFPSAQVIQLVVLAELFSQFESGKLDPDAPFTLEQKDIVEGGILYECGVGRQFTLREMARLMTIIYDNTAANIIVDRVGRDNINARMRALGLNDTVLNDKFYLNNATNQSAHGNVQGSRSPGHTQQVTSGKSSKGGPASFFSGQRPRIRIVSDKSNNAAQDTANDTGKNVPIQGTASPSTTAAGNTTSAVDMLNVVHALDSGTVITGTWREEAINILKDQFFVEKIQAELPDGVWAANKTAFQAGVRHDVGIIGKGDNRMMLAVLTDKVANPWEADYLIAKIARLCVQAMP